jgi:hypothetical protein
MASGTLANYVIIPSNPYFQFLQPNVKWVGFVPKIRSATKQRDGLNPTQKTGLDPTQPSQPSTKHTARNLWCLHNLSLWCSIVNLHRKT